MKKVNYRQQLLKTFKIFDRDGNQTISAEELKKVMKSLNNCITSQEAEELFRCMGKFQEEIRLGELLEFVMKNLE